MKKLYTSQDHMMVAFLRGILESDGVACLVKHELLAGAAGELPPIECWPELWITDDDQYPRAHELVRATLDAQADDAHGWQCPHCSERLEGQFAQCWNCGRLRYRA